MGLRPEKVAGLGLESVAPFIGIRSTQGINDPQYVFQSQSGLACFKIDDEAHTNTSCQRQLGLGQAELFASGTQCIAEMLRRSNGCHGLPSFPFGKLSATNGLCAS